MEAQFSNHAAVRMRLCACVEEEGCVFIFIFLVVQCSD